MRRQPPDWMIPVATGIVLALRWLTTPRGLDEVGPVAIRDAGLSLLLWVLVGVLAAGAGHRLLAVLRLQPSPPSFSWLLAEALGLGAVASWMLVLGLASLLTPTAITISLLLLSVVVARPTAEALAWLAGVPSGVRSAWLRSAFLPRLAMLLLFAIFGLALLHTLAPPWDNDSLMYHLVGPRMFLEARRIYPVPDIWYVNGAFNAELLYLIGMAFGDDVFPKLVHYLFGLLAVSATWMLGKRWVGGSAGWLAACVLVGIPTLPVWASFSYVDLAWAVFEFLALACVLEWWDQEEAGWLVLGGLFLGLAMGTKYTAMASPPILGLAVLWRVRRAGWRAIVRAGIAIGVPAILVALPWYLKNLIWFGNPVYPLYFGGPEWDARRLELYMGYLSGFGMGKDLRALLLLPWNLYFNHPSFGTTMNRIDIPNILFLLLFAYPLLPRQRTVSTLLLISLARIGVWFTGSQQLRFLLPVAPVLSIATGYVIMQLSELQRRRKLPLQQFLPSLAVALLVVTLTYQVVMLGQFRSAQVILGRESRAAFLANAVKDFPVIRAAQEELPDGSRVLQIGGGRSYHCLPFCIPDPDHFRWAAEIAELPSDASLTEWLAELGATHVLLSTEDLTFLLQHDQQHLLRSAVQRLLRYRDSGCLTEADRNKWAVLYRAACHGDETY